MLGRSVYAARCLFTNGEPTGLLKIGFAVDPDQRVSTIGSIVPFEFELIGFFEGGFFSEATTHLLLQRWRSKGEYFWDGPEIRQALDQMLRQCRPHPLIKDAETCGVLPHEVDLRQTLQRLDLRVKDVASRLSVDPGYLSTRLKREAKASRVIAAGISLAAADKGVKTVWPRDFRKLKEAKPSKPEAA